MKTNKTNPKDDLQAIRDIMERSTRFLSLSGLSGIFAGVCALIGAAGAWWFNPDAHHAQPDGDTFGWLFSGFGLYLVLDAALVLIFAAIGAAYFSYRKARKTGQQFWNLSAKRLLIHLLIPLVSGGFFTLILVFQHHVELVASVMLIFYGLSLVNAGKFTFGEIHYLGLTEIFLGILAGLYLQYGLLFWTIGFGVMHIVYGSVMYYRHER